MSKPQVKFTKKEKLLIIELYNRGLTDQQVADIIGIPRKTFTDQLKYNKLTATIKKVKEEPNEEMEKSLFMRGKGMTLTETRTEMDIVDGVPQAKKVIKIEKDIPPDTAAAFIWLKNRTKRWKDKQENVVTFDEDNVLQIEFINSRHKKKKKNKED